MMLFVTQQLASPNATSFDELIIQISSPGGGTEEGANENLTHVRGFFVYRD